MPHQIKKTLAVIMVIIMTVTAVPLANLSDLTPTAKADTANYQAGDIIEFGYYPQAQVSDTGLITVLNSLVTATSWRSLNYYSGDGTMGSMQPGDFIKYADVTYKGTKYRCIQKNAERPTSTTGKLSVFETPIIRWFIFQPISWLVINPEHGIVISKTPIDAQPFNNTVYNDETSNNDKEHPILANDYEHSSVRQWLNDDFYYTAFSETERQQIQTSLLDNKAYDNKSEFDSNPTADKIYLPSYSDYHDAKNWFEHCIFRGSNYSNMVGFKSEKNGVNSWLYKTLCRTAGHSSTSVVCINYYPDGTTSARFNVDGCSYVKGIMPMMQLNLLHTNDNITGTSGHFTYRNTGNNTCTIIQASPILNGIVTIPSEINGLKVTSISASAFANCTRITQLTIPSSVVYIGENAFSDLMGLQDIYFKSGSCKILGSANTIPPKAAIHSCSCSGTDVKEYAEKQGRKFLESIAQQTILGTKDTCYRTTCPNCYTAKNYNDHTVSDIGNMQFCTVCNYMIKTGVESGIDKLLAVYPTDAYFTKSGKAYNANSGSDCLLQNIPSRGGLPSGAEAYYDSCWSCCAFARYAYYVIFGESIAKAQSTTYTTSSFSGAQIGDVVFMHKKGNDAGTGHWGVYLGYADGKISIYDSNWNHSNQVIYGNKINLKNYSDTITVYHSGNYNLVNEALQAQTKKFITIDAVFHCPIEITVSYNGETLNSSENKLKTSFGSMKKNDDGSIALSLDYNDNYDFKVIGTDYGTMDVEAIITTTDSGDITYNIYNIPLTDVTSMEVNTDKTSGALVFVADIDGDKNNDTTYTVEKNETVYCDSLCATDADHELVQLIEACEATCNENGYTDSYFCIKCGKLTTKPEITPATGHSFGDWAVIKEPTCTEDGVQTRKCAVCEETEEKIIESTGHKAVTVKAIDATCTEDGKTEGSYCSVCDKVLIEQQIVPATGHTDIDNDGKCDDCKIALGTNIPSIENCDCMCHKSGFLSFFYKLSRIFWKIFQINKTCSCGASHY